MANWKPNANSQAILARAWAILESVPYSVSTRWLFYRLLQEGYYSGKGDYKNKFVKLTARARREFYEGWTPGTLADETREPITRGRGLGNSRTPDDWLRFMADNVSCALDKWHGQENYVELWFEARAMATQFEHYTDHITLVPMGGQPSLDLKWGLARSIDNVSRRYGVPVKILYFGDLDDAGGTISEVVERDVRAWSRTEFEYIHCGLTIDQVRRWNVPENFEKPGQYQWEAVHNEK